MAEAQHPTVETRTVPVNALRVHLREWPALGEDAGAPLLLVHGNWSTHRWWIPLAAALREAGFTGRLIAPDLLGRGDTAGPDHGYSIGELADDLLGLLDALELPRVHAIGHSLGSAVVMELARRAGSRLASLVAMSPAWVDGMPEAYAVPAGQEALHADRELLATALAQLAPKATHDELWRELIVTGHRQRKPASLRNIDALLAWAPGDALAELAMPSLVVDGELDALCGGAVAERATAALAGERVTLAGVGHSPNLEAPAKLARVLIDWLARCS